MVAIRSINHAIQSRQRKITRVLSIHRTITIFQISACKPNLIKSKHKNNAQVEDQRKIREVEKVVKVKLTENVATVCDCVYKEYRIVSKHLSGRGDV